MKNILKTRLLILITSDSASILAAETVTILFCHDSVFFAITPVLIIGTFILTLVESTMKVRNQHSKPPGCYMSESHSEFISSSDSRRLRKKSLHSS